MHPVGSSGGSRSLVEVLGCPAGLVYNAQRTGGRLHLNLNRTCLVLLHRYCTCLVVVLQGPVRCEPPPIAPFVGLFEPLSCRYRCGAVRTSTHRSFFEPL